MTPMRPGLKVMSRARARGALMTPGAPMSPGRDRSSHAVSPGEGGTGALPPEGSSPRLFDMSSFYLGFPAEVRRKITGHDVKTLRAMDEAFTAEKLIRLGSMSHDVDLRFTGRPMATKLMPPSTNFPLGELAMTVRPGVLARIPVRKAYVRAVLGREPSNGMELLQALEELRSNAVWALHVTSIDVVRSRHGDVVRLGVDRAVPLIRVEAPPGTQEYDEAMALLAMLDSGDRVTAMSYMLGVPASESLLRVFLPRLMTLFTPSRIYGHELRNTTCPALLQVHPSGTGKSYFSSWLKDMVPSSIIVVGRVSRTSLIYDGQLKTEGPALTYRHVVWDEFGIAKMDAATASAIEGTLKGGMSTGRRVRSGQGTGGKPIVKDHVNYRRLVANPVAESRGSKKVMQPSNQYMPISDAMTKIFAVLGFRHPSAWTRRFTRVDLLWDKASIDGVTDGEYALWTPHGKVVHPKALRTLIMRLRRHPDVMAKRGLFVRQGHVWKPRLLDEVTSGATLSWLNDRWRNMVEHLAKAPWGAATIEIPHVEPRLDHIMPTEQIVGHDDSDKAGGETEEVEPESEVMEESEEPMALQETPTEVMSKLMSFQGHVHYRHDRVRHVWLIESDPVARIWCVDDLCLGYRGSLDRLDKQRRDLILDVIRHAHASDMAETQEEEESHGGESHDERTAQETGHG